jgi:hypothetical protein
MSGFDFLFALFSLLLGLAMAEVLGGFARVMKLHARARAGHGSDVRVGRLVPLLAGFVLMGQLTCWTTMFNVGAQLPFNFLTLLVVTLIVGANYLFASLVWPDDPADWPDFDAYYDQHNRFILIGNLIPTVTGLVLTGIYPPPPERALPTITDPTVLAALGLVMFGALAINIVLIFVRGRRLNALLLVMLIAMQLSGSALFALAAR